MTNNTKPESVPGLLLPTVQPMLAATPRLSAIQQQKDMNNYQNSLIKSTGGATKSKRMRKRNHKSRGGAVTVPQFNMSYKPTGGPGQTPNDVIKNISQTSTQGKANSVYDNEVYGKGYPNPQTQKGGRRKTRSEKSKMLASRFCLDTMTSRGRGC
jgi:hypothetical protein